jgi:hypothetical protein
VPVLISGDHGHPEWDAAIDLMDDLALSSGYRTDDLAERLRQKGMEEARDFFARTPEPAPSGQEIRDEVITMVMQKSADEYSPGNIIEDYRKIPRNVTVPSHMRTPSIPGEAPRVRR